jgi:hypothetical protein
MKLFKSLLIAPAALGLLAPMSATANELNMTDVSDYSSSKEVQSISEFNSKQLAITNGRVDGLEARMNNYEAGSFSSTTTATFSADMAIGAVDGGTATTDDAFNAAYGFQIDLNTSFTGEDSLDVAIDAGSASAVGIAEFDLNDASETLTIDGISYSFPLYGATVLVGDSVDGSVFFDYACRYDTPSDAMDACGAPNSAFEGDRATLAVSYDFENGWYGAFGYAGEGNGTDGLLTAEGEDMYGVNVSYTGDNYGASVSYAMLEDAQTIKSDEYQYADTHLALNAYYQPDGLPTFSFGYEWGHEGHAADATDELSSYFVGVQFEEVGPGTLGVAYGTKAATTEGSEDLIMYEAFYAYDINDGMTVTPLIFVKENSGTTDDETGLMVKTSFSF